MADWYGNARSNYFKVKDEGDFRDFCDKWSLEPYGKQGKYCFVSANEFGRLPTALYNADCEQVAEFEDFLHDLSDHLVEDEVAILMEVGAEKLRYLTGMAVALNSRCETKAVDISQIYDLAKELGGNITRCEY